MVRFVCILIGIYNLFFMSIIWGVGIESLFKLLPKNLELVGTISFLVFVLFLLIHSISLIIFKQSSIKIQYVLSGFDPIVRIIASLYLTKSLEGPEIGFLTVMIPQVLFIIFDIFTIFYLRSKRTSEAFEQAAVFREKKFRDKLMSKNL